ncbi:transglutaminase domain-containing protein [Alicyclobacillaceae bacterium I2511]|nr:transglutaminase domain-containing protein [Alicyclobacillaceae bacterium I2511]
MAGKSLWLLFTAVMSAMTLSTTLAMADTSASSSSSMPSTPDMNGYEINDNFYLSSEVMTNPAMLAALNQALAANPGALVLDLNGNVANYTDFLNTHPTGNLMADFVLYCQQHPFAFPQNTLILHANGSTTPFYPSQTTTTATNTALFPTSLTTLPTLTDNVSLPSMIGSQIPNGAQPDESYWQNSSTNFYLMAQTFSTGNVSAQGGTSNTAGGVEPLPATSSTTSTLQPSSTPALGAPMVDLQPGQTLQLFAYENSANISAADCTWQVNSPEATLTPQNAHEEWTDGTYSAAEATFTASQAGVYTVQASYQGKASVPLVLDVGTSALPAVAVNLASGQTGILPLPSGLPQATPVVGQQFTYTESPPVDGWIPVVGMAHTPSSHVTVILNGTSGVWTYTLPEQSNGSFAALVRSPFSGNVTVGLIPDLFQSLNTTGSYSFTDSYQESVNYAEPSLLYHALLASAMRDYNMNLPLFQATASRLVAASPSPDTAIAAVSNWVSADILYNYPAYADNHIPWQNSEQTLQGRLGVCQDIANLTAALLDSVGIPTQTIGGTAVDASGTAPQSHEWDKAWDGHQWVVFDPTWNEPLLSTSQTVNSLIYSEYMTDTQSLQSSHTAGNQQTGTAFSPKFRIALFEKSKYQSAWEKPFPLSHWPPPAVHILLHRKPVLASPV